MGRARVCVYVCVDDNDRYLFYDKPRPVDPCTLVFRVTGIWVITKSFHDLSPFEGLHTSDYENQLSLYKEFIEVGRYKDTLIVCRINVWT